jgi:hypothetical protein
VALRDEERYQSWEDELPSEMDRDRIYHELQGVQFSMA